MAASAPPWYRRRPGRVGRLMAAVGFAVVWWVLLAPTGLGGPVGMIWVSGSSMEPGMHTGDLALMYQRSSYGVGDVVAFEIPEGGTVIHRIIEVTDAGYRFQGDNRDFADPWELPTDDIVGKRVISVPHAAEAMTFLGRPISLAVLVAILSGLWWSDRSGSAAPRQSRRTSASRPVLP